jgi:hypothetical protein
MRSMNCWTVLLGNAVSGNISMQEPARIGDFG